MQLLCEWFCLNQWLKKEQKEKSSTLKRKYLFLLSFLDPIVWIEKTLYASEKKNIPSFLKTINYQNNLMRK